MKKQPTTAYYRARYHTRTFFIGAACILILLLAVFRAGATALDAKQPQSLNQEIEEQLKSGNLALHFPKTVHNYYTSRQYTPIWLVKEPQVQNTWAAMLMLDCVLQFGLNKADYHANELLYTTLHDILEQPGQISPVKQARFEIMLTDALVTFINYIHYGKYNPSLPAAKIDKGITDFNATRLLDSAIKSNDLMAVVLTAQPQGALYQYLQARLHTVAGVQLGDCYEFPEKDVRKMALNMERLRWSAADTSTFIMVNIPSYTLTFRHHNISDTFKVITGTPKNPTPTLNSAVKFFTTAPAWKVPNQIFTKEILPKAMRDSAYLNEHHYSVYTNKGLLADVSSPGLLKIAKSPKLYYAQQSAGCDNALGQIVFRFANPFDIYMHDTPDQSLFAKSKRALSHGCVRVQNATQLAKLLLINDGQSTKIFQKNLLAGITKSFYLKKPVSLAITYITCEVKNGALVYYDDIYGLDNSLDQLMYQKNDATLKLSEN
ncbi:hypothetical protein CKK33_15250 [Mucilaginibacter sp. MD40]|uniref:L,D-transpeptidase family protein n=1 Tax=Mucilaginibacter sp. MD40 TaxID=2029590 RepID=UPI000BAC9676|nr:L,D-transpeptidase family protein [Mucilaginibacter sp. MD40]PAW94777.1 hypothetical protein CKK33_15250 [Mucilaginibacter sp. MD40]